MKIPFQYPFLYCPCNAPGIDTSIKCPLEVTADDYLVEGIKLCSFRRNPSCFYRSTNNGKNVTIFVTQLEITETLLTRLIDGNASQYVATFKTTEALL